MILETGKKLTFAVGLGLAASLFPVCTAYATPVIKHVIVIVMENVDAEKIYGNKKLAPYINSELMPKYAHATDFQDQLSIDTLSEPHYIWMEAGTNTFPDYTFSSDDSVSAERSTSSTEHLVTQIERSGTLAWMSYQEGMGPETGACPIIGVGKYAVRHNPFVYFRDVSGSPPDVNNEYCAAHHKPFSALADDMASGNVANYVFITPDLCNDMHDTCGKKNRILAGDTWLKQQMPSIIDWLKQNSGVAFIAWDEADSAAIMPFLAIGPGVKENYAGDVYYTHGSILKTVEVIFGLPVLPTVSDDETLSDLFKEGQFP